MTGFGRGTADAEGLVATVEVRSVNNRFCEVRVRLPRLLAAFEGEVQTIVKAALDRGKIDVTVQVDRVGEHPQGLAVNAPLARAYKHLLEDLRAATGVEEPVSLEHLLRYSDLFTTVDDEGAAQEAWAVTKPALGVALDALKAMREQEGRALQADLAHQLDTIESFLGLVEDHAPARVEEARVRLQDRVQELLTNTSVDPDRLELEIALLADKLDVTEECVRLDSHLQQFRAAFDSEDATGRKLNFLVQEMNREINTIGSKSNDAAMAHQAVAMKEALEKIREQVNNVE